jgi:pimeloyl-ACP methyl ester carboxylesterase
MLCEVRLIATFLRRLGKVLLALVLLVIVAIASFRLAASLRETATRDELAPANGRLVETSSGRIFLQEKGPAGGVPVVLVHGTAAWSELWRGTIDALAVAGFHVIALDMPPFGFSDRPGDYTRSRQAARVNDALTKLQAAPAIIVGHSFGAGSATEFAMQYPARSRALVLVDAALGLTSPPGDPPVFLRPHWIREVLVSLTITNPLATRMLLQSLIEKKERALPKYIDVLQRPTHLRGSTPDIADWLYYFAGSDVSAQSADGTAYTRLKIPVAIIWGEKDTVTPIEQARDLQQRLPRSTLTVLSGLGHIPQIEDPDAFNAALLKSIGNL